MEIDFAVQGISREQRQGHSQQPSDFARAQGMFSEYLQHIGEQRDARAEEDEADKIERMGVLFAKVRQMKKDDNQPDHANRDIQEEDDTPVKVADDQSAGDRAEHRRYQCGDGDKAHGAEQFGLGEGSHQG